VKSIDTERTVAMASWTTLPADDGEPLRHAFLAVRPCDLPAIAVKDRVPSAAGRGTRRTAPGCSSSR